MDMNLPGEEDVSLDWGRYLATRATGGVEVREKEGLESWLLDRDAQVWQFLPIPSF